MHTTYIDTETGLHTMLSLSTAVQHAAQAIGDRTAVEAQRLGLSFDSFPGLDFAIDQTERILWRDCGCRLQNLQSDQAASLTTTFVDGYRFGYEEGWSE